MPAHKINFYFNSSDSLRSFASEARRIAELQQVFLKTAPPSLTQACCVKQLRAGILFLLAENAAIAAKLKQLAPRLLTAYQQQRIEITSIRIEVQVRGDGRQLASNRSPRFLSAESIKNLERLADGLEESPLKQVIAGLAAKQRSKN